MRSLPSLDIQSRVRTHSKLCADQSLIVRSRDPVIILDSVESMVTQVTASLCPKLIYQSLLRKSKKYCKHTFIVIRVRFFTCYFITISLHCIVLQWYNRLTFKDIKLIHKVKSIKKGSLTYESLNIEYLIIQC